MLYPLVKNVSKVLPPNPPVSLGLYLHIAASLVVTERLMTFVENVPLGDGLLMLGAAVSRFGETLMMLCAVPAELAVTPPEAV